MTVIGRWRLRGRGATYQSPGQSRGTIPGNRAGVVGLLVGVHEEAVPLIGHRIEDQAAVRRVGGDVRPGSPGLVGVLETDSVGIAAAIVQHEPFLQERVPGHRQLSDAWLVALCGIAEVRQQRLRTGKRGAAVCVRDGAEDRARGRFIVGAPNGCPRRVQAGEVLPCRDVFDACQRHPRQVRPDTGRWQTPAHPGRSQWAAPASRRW